MQNTTVLANAWMPNSVRKPCRSDRLLAYQARFGLSNRLLEVQTALRVAQLSNRTLLLPALLAGIQWDDAFDVSGLMSRHCVVREGKRAPSAAQRAVALKLPGEHSKMRSFLGLPIHELTISGVGDDGMDTRGLAAHMAREHADEPLVVLLSTLHVLRERSAACESARVRPHCTRPGVGFWTPPPPFVKRFWRSLVLPSAAVARRVRRITRTQGRFVGVHMRNADGSCPTRVQVWYGGMRLHPPRPKCGKVKGCTSLDTSCCDFTLVPQPGGSRFSAALLREVAANCEEQLADAALVSSLASRSGLTRVYVGADGQRPDLERQLLASLRAKGLQPHNASQPRPSSHVWSSRYARAGRAAADRWRLSDLEDGLVDMFVLADAEVFVANPASSYSGCVRDIRAAQGRPLASTQVGIPPHDARSWREVLQRGRT